MYYVLKMTLSSLNQIQTYALWDVGTYFFASLFSSSTSLVVEDILIFLRLTWSQCWKHVPLGRRQCLGETLAKAELFLFFSGILQQFVAKPEVEGQPPSEVSFHLQLDFIWFEILFLETLRHHIGRDYTERKDHDENVVKMRFNPVGLTQPGHN